MLSSTPNSGLLSASEPTPSSEDAGRFGQQRFSTGKIGRWTSRRSSRDTSRGPPRVACAADGCDVEVLLDEVPLAALLASAIILAGFLRMPRLVSSTIPSFGQAAAAGTGLLLAVSCLLLIVDAGPGVLPRLSGRPPPLRRCRSLVVRLASCGRGLCSEGDAGRRIPLWVPGEDWEPSPPAS